MFLMKQKPRKLPGVSRSGFYCRRHLPVYPAPTKARAKKIPPAGRDSKGLRQGSGHKKRRQDDP